MTMVSPKRKTRWSDAEIALLLQLYKAESNQQLADRLGRSKSAVRGKLICMGLERRPIVRGELKADEGIGLIPLRGKYGNGKVAIVDAPDYAWLMQWKWTVSDKGYVRRKATVGERKAGASGSILMHREIIQPLPEQVTDHINQNRLDNRRENLRACSGTENARNRVHNQGCLSAYKGITQNSSGKWGAKIHYRGAGWHLGVFTTEEEAARVYDSAALHLHGEFACTNFEDGVPMSVEEIRKRYIKDA